MSDQSIRLYQYRKTNIEHFESKPLHIKKILNNYPLVYHMRETEIITKESIIDCESFLLKCKEEHQIIPFDRIRDAFSDFTMSEMLNRFQDQMIHPNHETIKNDNG